MSKIMLGSHGDLYVINVKGTEEYMSEATARELAYRILDMLPDQTPKNTMTLRMVNPGDLELDDNEPDFDPELKKKITH
jgi:hypothetical protein